jgi:hypothetical protein
MAVIDKINRRGDTAKRVITGPGELVGPNADSRKRAFSSVTRITGSVDFYEITDGSGAGAADYTVTVRPYSENGFSKSLGGIGRVVLVKQADGVNSPTAAASVLAAKKPASGTSSVTLGPFTTTTDDKLFVVVERDDVSTIKYQLEVDKT